MKSEPGLVSLDASIASALGDLIQRRVSAPDVLFFLGTGVGMLPSNLRPGMRVPLGQLAGAPAAWANVLLYAGEFRGTPAWLVEDAAGPPEHGTNPPWDEPPWVRGFPCWLAAAAGAVVCVHTSAGLGLQKEGGTSIPAGSLALVRDHINMSGSTPLIGLGGSKLGPLFPDPSRLHHDGLRAAALASAHKLGVPVAEAIAACTPGPAMETPAERRYWARAGAEVAVQGLATPLLASAHAGLAVLSIVAVTDDAGASQDIGAVVAKTDRLAPALEDLLGELAPELKRVARELGVDA